MHQSVVPVEGQVAGLRFKHLCSCGADAPLFVLVHGRAGNFDVMWAFKRVMPEGVNLLAPQAPLSDGAGFSWWEIGKPKEEMRAAAQDAANGLGVFVESYVAANKLTPRAVVLVGFSQGGALISVLAQNGRMAINGVALLASFAIKIAGSRVACPVFIAHGSSDEIITISQSESSRDYLKSCGAEVTFVVDDVGHKVGVSGMRALKEWTEALIR